MGSVHVRLLLAASLLAGCKHTGQQATTSAPQSVRLPSVESATQVASFTRATPVASQATPAVVPALATIAFAETAIPSQPSPVQQRSALPATQISNACLLPITTNITVGLPTASQEPAAPETGLGLESAIETSLLQNPDLVTLRGQVGVSRAVAGVTTVYPWNPFIQSQYFPNGRPFVPSTAPGSGAGMSNYYVWAMQRFEIAHQRRYRAQIASAAVTQAQWNVQQAELLNVAQATRLYFATLYQRELRDLAVETAELNGRLLGVVERRFKANLGTVAEVTTAKVAARQSRRQADLAEATYQAALLVLRQQLNLPLDRPLNLGQRISDFGWAAVPSLEATDTGAPPSSPGNLAAELVQGRPDLMAAAAGIMVANANTQLARAARVPDIQAGPIYETGDDGTRYLGMRLQTDVPVWNNGSPLLNQRRAEAQQQRLTYGQLHQRATLEAQAAIDRYERARLLVEKSATDPSLANADTPTELREITAQFEAGQAEILAVYVTQANLLLDRRTYLDLLNETAQAAANVVQATALPPTRLALPRRPEVIPVPPLSL